MSQLVEYRVLQGSSLVQVWHLVTLVPETTISQTQESPTACHVPFMEQQRSLVPDPSQIVQVLALLSQLLRKVWWWYQLLQKISANSTKSAVRCFMSVSWSHATTMGHANSWEVDIFAYAQLDIQAWNVKQKWMNVNPLLVTIMECVKMALGPLFVIASQAILVSCVRKI